jgi:hypothetical protein
MADPGPYPGGEADPGSKNDPGTRLGRGPTGGTPRWLGVVGILVAIALVALVVVLHLTGTLGGGVHQ